METNLLYTKKLNSLPFALNPVSPKLKILLYQFESDCQESDEMAIYESILAEGLVLAISEFL